MEIKHSIIFADDLWELINSSQIKVWESPVYSGVKLLEIIFKGFPVKPIVVLNGVVLNSCNAGLLPVSQNLINKGVVLGFDPANCSFSLHGKGIPIADVYEMYKRISFASPDAVNPNVQHLHDALRKTRIHLIEICCDAAHPQIDNLIKHLEGF